MTGDGDERIDREPVVSLSNAPTPRRGLDGSIVFAERVLVWVDRTVSRLMSETRHRALMRRARRADDRLEQAVNRSRGKDREC